MGKDSILVAAYGTLRRGYGNSRLVDKGNNHLGTGKTIEKFTMRANGIPYVSQEPTSNIVVDVWEIDKEQLKHVDALEGHPNWYKRKQVDVSLNDKTLSCWLYFNEGHGTVIESGDYRDYRN